MNISKNQPLSIEEKNIIQSAIDFAHPVNNAYDEDGEKYLQLLKDKIVNEDTVRFSDLMSPAILIHLTPSLRRYKEITKMNIAEPTNKESDVRLLQEKWRCCSDLIIILMDVAERLYGITL